MHPTLEAIRAHLEQLIVQIQSTVPSDEPIGVAHGAWNLPSLTRTELIEDAQRLIDLIDQRGADEVAASNDARLLDYGRRLEHLRSQTIPQFWGGNAGQAIAAFMFTLGGLRKVLEPAFDTRSSRGVRHHVAKVDHEVTKHGSEAQ